MPNVELIMPKMGESIMEATILKWLKQKGDSVEADEPVLEIATDKVDSEVPAVEAGVIVELLYNEGDVVPVGKPVAIISTERGAASGGADAPAAKAVPEPRKEAAVVRESAPVQAAAAMASAVKTTAVSNSNGHSDRFYSPLVMNIARQEGISMSELEQLPGSGRNNRVTKKDILSYVEGRGAATATTVTAAPAATPAAASVPQAAPVEIPTGGNVEVIEMDRMRKMIAEHMVRSKHTSPHVTSFVEADVTNMVMWRNKVKDEFQRNEGEKITFTPLFVEAVVKALKDFPMVNISVSGDKIIRKKDLNIGMAAALPSGNLIVPVIKNADQFNLVGLTKRVNDLAERARTNKLKPEEIEGGTFTLTNVGTFGNVMGTPIINQPQAAILATGAIRKKPVVIETDMGDTIAIRHMMFLSLSYDHRVVDGFLGGSFLRRVADYLEAFDQKRSIA